MMILSPRSAPALFQYAQWPSIKRSDRRDRGIHDSEHKSQKTPSEAGQERF